MVHTTPTKVLLTTTLRPLVVQLSGSLAHGVRLLDQFLGLAAKEQGVSFSTFRAPQVFGHWLGGEPLE